MPNPLPDFVPLNWDIISNPVNWVIIVLMVLLATIFLVMITGALGHANTNISDE